MPTRVGQPRGITGLTDLVSGPEFSTVVGLAIGGTSLPVARKAPETNRNAPIRVMKKVGNWFSEHF